MKGKSKSVKGIQRNSDTTKKNTPSRCKESNALANTAEEVAFLEAMDEYQKSKQRPFPTWSEVLEVVKSLGYSKEASTSRATFQEKELLAACAKLKEERDHLRLELSKLRAKHAEYSQMLYALTWEEIEIKSKKEMLAMVGKGQPLEEIIADLEAELKAEGTIHE
jgi:hypothetical protein